MEDVHDSGGSVSSSLVARVLWVYIWVSVSSFPHNIQHVLSGIPHPSLSLIFFLWSRDLTDRHLVMFMKLHQTFVWKTLLTVMHAWFMRGLQENGGGGRVPNTASAFIFDITKRSSGWRPVWSLLESKTQTCAFCWWCARKRLTMPSASTSLPRAAKLLARASESWWFCVVSLMYMGWGRGTKELYHGIWSPPSPPKLSKVVFSSPGL